MHEIENREPEMNRTVHQANVRTRVPVHDIIVSQEAVEIISKHVKWVKSDPDHRTNSIDTHT